MHGVLKLSIISSTLQSSVSMLVWFIRRKRRTFGPFFPQMKILHLYFWKKKHKYHTSSGAIYRKSEVKSVVEEEEWEEDEEAWEENWEEDEEDW